MDSKRDIARQKQELVGRLDGLRDSLGRDRRELVHTLNPARRFAAGFSRHPLRTFGVACLGSAVITMLFRRRPKPPKEKKKTFSKALSAAALAALQPALKHWVSHLVKQRLSDRTKQESSDSLLGP